MNYEMFNTKDKIHISAGLPCISVLNFRRIIKVISKDFRKEHDQNIFQYGFSSGYERFREKLAMFIWA